MGPSCHGFTDVKLNRRRLCFEASKLKSSSTDTQKANVEHRRLILQKRIAAFRDIQCLHMPEVAPFLLSDTRIDHNTPETLPLYLPHELPLASRSSQNLCNAEAKLRFAQATDALAELRRSLSVFAHLRSFKIREVRGQRANTRANTLVEKSQSRTNAIAARYRDARDAYFKLEGSGAWEQQLQILKKEDIRPMVDHEERPQKSAAQMRKEGPREGHRVLSWIWMAPSIVNDDSDEMHAGTCIISSHLYLATEVNTSSPSCRVGKISSAKAQMDGGSCHT